MGVTLGNDLCTSSCFIQHRCCQKQSLLLAWAVTPAAGGLHTAAWEPPSHPCRPAQCKPPSSTETSPLTPGHPLTHAHPPPPTPSQTAASVEDFKRVLERFTLNLEEAGTSGGGGRGGEEEEEGEGGGQRGREAAGKPTTSDADSDDEDKGGWAPARLAV